jgi:hypothetical protein
MLIQYWEVALTHMILLLSFDLDILFELSELFRSSFKFRIVSLASDIWATSFHQTRHNRIKILQVVEAGSCRVLKRVKFLLQLPWLKSFVKLFRWVIWLFIIWDFLNQFLELESVLLLIFRHRVSRFCRLNEFLQLWDLLLCEFKRLFESTDFPIFAANNARYHFLLGVQLSFSFAHLFRLSF